jgi:hypothetical protein
LTYSRLAVHTRTLKTKATVGATSDTIATAATLKQA